MKRCKIASKRMPTMSCCTRLFRFALIEWLAMAMDRLSDISVYRYVIFFRHASTISLRFEWKTYIKWCFIWVCIYQWWMDRSMHACPGNRGIMMHCMYRLCTSSLKKRKMLHAFTWLSKRYIPGLCFQDPFTSFCENAERSEQITVSIVCIITCWNQLHSEEWLVIFIKDRKGKKRCWL